jgi:branched-chain amino acid transport system ATP-binding protein
MKILELKNITRRFGGLIAVNGLDFHLDQGEILGLIGPNGAGKTTVFNMITGMLRPSRGDIVLLGDRITGFTTNRIARMGAVRTFQLTNLFPEMSVIENVILGTHHRMKVGFLRSLYSPQRAKQLEILARNKAQDILEFMDLADEANVPAKNLPHGRQRKLEVAIALAADPKLLLLDEPLQGMNQDEVEDMLTRIRKMNDSGKTVLVVEHNMKAVTKICDRVVVLDFGRKIAEGSPKTVMLEPSVIEAYLGLEA